MFRSIHTVPLAAAASDAAPHSLRRDAVALGLPEGLLVRVPAHGVMLPGLFGPLQGSRLWGDGGHEVLDASIELDAADFPEVGPRSRFAMDLRLAMAPDGRVTTAEVETLEWRNGDTLFAPVPRATGSGHGFHGIAGRLADAVLAWLATDAALPALMAAAEVGAGKAERDAAVAGSAASWSLAAGARSASEPALQAHHLWWAARRDEEARRHAAVASFLRDRASTLAARLDRAALAGEA